MIKKAIAAFLLFLLAFIYIEKGFHGHDTESFSIEKGISQWSQNNSCAICDFKLSRELELPIQSHSEKLFTYVTNDGDHQVIFIVASNVTNTRDRAPPSV